MKYVSILPLAATLLAAALIAVPAAAEDVSYQGKKDFLSNRSKLKVVNIPQSNWTVIAAAKGWWTEEYGKLGLKYQIVDQGTSALSGAEASLLSRGDLHFAFRMAYPSLVHKTNGIEASIIWASKEQIKFRTPILALRDSKIESLADVDGKIFIGSRVGCGWSAPYEALKVNQTPLDTNDVKGRVRYVNSGNTTATVAALLSGRADFLATHIQGNPWANLTIQGTIKVIGYPAEDGAYLHGGGRTAIFTLTKFAQEHPEVVKVFLDVRLKVAKWAAENVDEAATIISREIRVPKYVARFQLTDPSSYDFTEGSSDYADVVQSFIAFQKWYKENGDDILSRQSLTDAEIAQFVDRRFFGGGEYSIYN
ncbi:MAG: ABC transporter substrate-binding protein [Opitutaceae bacterium]